MEKIYLENTEGFLKWIEDVNERKRVNGEPPIRVYPWQMEIVRQLLADSKKARITSCPRRGGLCTLDVLIKTFQEG